MRIWCFGSSVSSIDSSRPTLTETYFSIVSHSPSKEPGNDGSCVPSNLECITLGETGTVVKCIGSCYLSPHSQCKTIPAPTRCFSPENRGLSEEKTFKKLRSRQAYTRCFMMMFSKGSYNDNYPACQLSGTHKIVIDFDIRVNKRIMWAWQSTSMLIMSASFGGNIIIIKKLQNRQSQSSDEVQSLMLWICDLLDWRGKKENK